MLDEADNDIHHNQASSGKWWINSYKGRVRILSSRTNNGPRVKSDGQQVFKQGDSTVGIIIRIRILGCHDK